MTRQEMIDGLIEARRLLDTPVAEVHYRRAQAHVLSAIVHLELHPESTLTPIEQDSEMCEFAEWIAENYGVMAYEDETKRWFQEVEETGPGNFSQWVWRNPHRTTDLLKSFRAQKKTTL